MSKALQEKIDELFQATKDLKSLEEIKPYCDRFNEWLTTQNYSEKSLGTLFSRYGLYSKFRTLPLEQGKNAELIPKHDDEGKVKGHELKHYVPLLCGLDRHQWAERNHTSQGIDRAENPTEIDPNPYLEVVGKLLASNDPHELAVGLIAVTGRRPHEVIARAKFSPVEGKPYQVVFEGQGKKRGKNPVFEIATLYPSAYVSQCLGSLRRSERVASLLKEVRSEFPGDISAQNRAIDSRINGSLNRVVREYFGDKGQENPVLAFRHEQDQDNCTALRAAYSVLATERDCKGSVGTKMLYASQLLGHFVKGEKPNDDDLRAFVRTAKYSDYYATKPVPFPTAPGKEKTTSIRVNESDLEPLKKLQEFWQLPNQQSVVSRLIERHELTVELGKQLQEYKAHINQLEKEKQEMLRVQTQQAQDQAQVIAQPQQEESTQMETLEAKIERLIEEKLSKALSNLAPSQPVQSVQPTQTTQLTPVKKQESVDWEAKSNAELWSSKVKGASEEKIRRSFNAIALYNDTVATGDDDRLAITNQALRELSGVNGLLVGDWIKSHADELISHNSKYGMQPLDDAGNLAKDKNTGEIRTDSYYNKRHGKEKITKILSLVNDQFLEGEALKSQQGK
ncbi:MAG TPA: protelomerase family protein [Coleofasciculaceae cyanobacterium]